MNVRKVILLDIYSKPAAPDVNHFFSKYKIFLLAQIIYIFERTYKFRMPGVRAQIVNERKKSN